MTEVLIEASYFPGCSLATSAKESNQSLIEACDFIGLKLIDLEDWNCCGSSSAHSLDPDLALELCARNLTLAPKNRPLLIMCPGCYKNLLGAHLHLKEDAVLRRAMERKWGGEIDPELKIVNFLEILHFMERLRGMGQAPAVRQVKSLSGMKVAAYYGCMNMFPPSMRRVGPPHNLLDTQLRDLGAEPVMWRYSNRCCGTFLTAAKPETAAKQIDEIMRAAIGAGAECLVTACAMCQLNVEIRCSIKEKLPIFHFTEMAAIVLGSTDYEKWFNRHIVDPRPLLKEKGLVD